MSDENLPGGYASPACMAAELAARTSGDAPGDAEWRRETRAALLAARGAMTPEARAGAETRIAARLDRLLDQRFGGARGLTIAGYWPIRGEVDLRGWMARCAARGIAIALPVVAKKDAPLVFRPWSPNAEMKEGLWKIPEPATDAVVTPQIVLAPLVGWDQSRFRMGYGGGFYDRTLAAMRPRPYAIGIGHEAARLDSIRPQPHDEALDLVVTEAE